MRMDDLIKAVSLRCIWQWSVPPFLRKDAAIAAVAFALCFKSAVAQPRSPAELPQSRKAETERETRLSQQVRQNFYSTKCDVLLTKNGSGHERGFAHVRSRKLIRMPNFLNGIRGEFSTSQLTHGVQRVSFAESHALDASSGVMPSTSTNLAI